MSAPITLQLDQPIVRTVSAGPGRAATEETIAELTLRCPTIGQVREATRAEADDIGRDLRLLAAMTGVEMPVIARLAMPDYARASKVLRDFLAPSPGTETS